MKKFALLMMLGVMLFTSCRTPHDIAYLQDVNAYVPIKTRTDGYIRFMPGDKLNIGVHSRDEKLMELFNIKSTNMMGNTSQQNFAAYTVDERGEIDFPVLGNIKIQGLTRDEVQRTIKYALINNSLVRDPVVTVSFQNMNFSVLGSAGTGVKEITKDRITLLEAIAMGDLDINGLRKNVLVMRQDGDRQIPYRVDLTSAESVYNSPAYYIRQNDVIYVEPNNKSKRNSTVMGSSAYQPAFWMSLLTFITSFTLIFVK